MTDRMDVPGAAARHARVPRRRWRVLRGWFALCVLALLAGGGCLAIGMTQVDLSPLHVTIGDGTGAVTVSGGTDAARNLLAIGGVALGLLALLLLPLLLVLVVALLALALALGVGLPAAVLALALCVVCAPAWMILFGIWLMRRRRAANAWASARMSA